MNTAFAANWYIKRKSANVTFWKSYKWPEAYLLVERKEKKNKRTIQYYKTPKYIKELESKKKKVLSYMGVSDWSASKYEVSEKTDGIQVDIYGNYKDRDSKTVFFHERHLYSKNYFIQSLMTAPDKGALEDRDVETIFTRSMSLAKDEAKQ